MNVVIVGYGRMGHMIESVLKQRGHQISAAVDPVHPEATHRKLDQTALANADGIIEFSLPGEIETRLKQYICSGIPTVIGTTGWKADEPRWKEEAAKKQAYILHGSNFSPGAHFFFALSESAAEMINQFSEYDIMLTEFHHRMKKDSPSGTALTAARRILDANKEKDTLAIDRIEGEIPSNHLHVASVRGGSIPGIHETLLDSPADSVSIRHTARDRSGFASGAVLALEWLQNRKTTGRPDWYSVNDFMQEILHPRTN